MKETPPFSPNIQVNSLKDYLFVIGNNCNIVTKVNRNIGIRLQTVLIGVCH